MQASTAAQQHIRSTKPRSPMPMNINLPSLTRLHKAPHTVLCASAVTHLLCKCAVLTRYSSVCISCHTPALYTCCPNTLQTHTQTRKITLNFMALPVHVPKLKLSAPDKFSFTYITVTAVQSSVMGNVCHCSTAAGTPERWKLSGLS
jgi:hypothetical protein